MVADDSLAKATVMLEKMNTPPANAKVKGKFKAHRDLEALSITLTLSRWEREQLSYASLPSHKRPANSVGGHSERLPSTLLLPAGEGRGEDVMGAVI